MKTRFKTGDVIDSRYEVVAVLPTGGMGELYKVRHVHLGDFRVVKIRKPTSKSDETGTKRFIREAKLAAAIKHPNLASLFDFARLDDGSFYMVNEYVDGMTIAEHIRAGGRFEIAQVLRIAEQALLALEAIHAAGIIHRDVASDNLMLAQSASDQTIVKLIDLGIAKTLDGEGLTSTGYFVGKARYASPEQVNTQDPEPIDQRSDLYSLGIVLYEMLSGDVPFAGSTPAASVIKRLTSEVTQVPPRDASIVIDPSTEAIILRLLRRNRDERFPSAAEALSDVRRLIAERPNYETEATLSRITRDRELYGVAGSAIPESANGPANPAPSKGGSGAKGMPTGTVEMSLEELAAADADEPQMVVVPPPPAAADLVEATNALPQLSSEERDRLMSGAANPAPKPPSPAPGDEPAETMPFQKWQQSQAPTVASELPKASPPNLPQPQDEIPTVATGSSMPKEHPPAPPPPPIVLPPPAPPRKASPPQPPASPPVPARAATNLAPPAKKGMSTKTLVIIIVVALFALAAFSLAGYAAFQLYKRYAAPRAALPALTEPTAAVESTATPAATDSGVVEIVETGTIPTSTAPQVIDTPPPTDTTASIAATTTIAPEKPKPPAKAPKKRETVPVATTTEPEAANEPAPEPEPQVSEGDLVEPGPGVIDAKLIAQQPLRLSIKDRVVKRTRGTATVAFIVGINGVPENPEIVESSGEDAIDKAALRAATASRFTPATKDGVKVRVRAVLTFSNEKQNEESQ
ncbi:MAG: TonB family protein [Acidobacteria bacterium]|nr:TonB family protein [Acidobacteriota bacterium]